MSLVGYHFPELENVEDDSNWLNVKIQVSHQRRNWSTIDPHSSRMRSSRSATG